MTIGPYKISPIETGDFRLDGGSMFGVVPKVLWSRTNPADEQNRIAMTMRVLLIEGEGRKILVDTGLGRKEKDSFLEMYAVDFSRNTLESSLSARGVRPEEITDVILTHLHFDHCGGATRMESGQAAPVFAKARHYVQRRQFEHALQASERDRASFLPHNYLPLREAGLLDLVDGEVELFPGIHVLVAEGHTPAMQTVKIQDGDQVLWFAADLIPMSAHVPLPYIMGYDLRPLTTLAEKKRWLPQALSEKWVIVYEHDPLVPAGRLTANERGHIVAGESVPA
ncbi:MAG: MBL fold metallo-hydrolase [bacterium]|nr:MBL fold metallo-hydrolase [bacterium]